MARNVILLIQNVSGISVQVVPDSKAKKTDKKKTNTEAGLIVGIVLSVVVAAVIVSVILLGVYGYRNPQSAAGQFLIKYRPSELSRKWSNSRGDDYRLNSQTLNNDAYEGNW